MNEHRPILREFQPADAAQVAQLITESVRGHWIYTPEQFKPSSVPQRFRLVAADSEVRATLAVSPFGDAAPSAFRLDFAGDAQFFNALYTLALTRLPQHAPLIGVAREDFSEQMQFFAAAGFRNAWQSWGAHLDLTRFDFAPYQALEERLFVDGYEVEQLANTAPEADWNVLYALSLEAVEDAPRNPTTTPDNLSLEEWWAMIVREETVFAARFRGQIIGFTRSTVRGEHLDTEHTAVSRPHRNKGLATILKARALASAQEQGCIQASTGGTVMNLPMLKVNHCLGYLPEPMWVTWWLER
ncbi:GNAT family N-acetyltransferase [Deinococcus psychrotolerans]|uniref:GNAT family N-acetyltransferase n=1 Tax=Deinococcus psychrotolerans TaxID=2489213 RepID=A0A3G8YEZ0_9DEIO|nr:GNAT family N-acetyltransferase [Deinococcus psychrotolerans]AZI43545.1 GNAT family N-acetyltransferase [Deinococcus psychrotolerans]